MIAALAALLLAQADLPDDPARAVVQQKCMICHTTEYVTQQRLTEGAWKKTVEKMRKFGSPIADEEIAPLVAYLAKNWTPTTAAGPVRLAPLPKGSLPPKAKK